MANTKSSKKDLRRTAKKTIRNKAVKSSLKTYVKKVRIAAASGDATTTGVAVVDVVSAMDKAVQRGVIHKNQAARRKSRIAKAANAVLKAGGAAVAAPKKEGKAKVAKPTAKAAAEKKSAATAAAKKPAAKPKAAAEKKPAAKKPKASE